MAINKLNQNLKFQFYRRWRAEMIKAFFVDFYGTLVHEDGEVIKKITDITGIVLTKLDGTAKGGIVLAIREEIKLPVKFIGLGEGIDDLKSFDIESYIYGLFKDMM